MARGEKPAVCAESHGVHVPFEVVQRKRLLIRRRVPGLEAEIVVLLLAGVVAGQEHGAIGREREVQAQPCLAYLELGSLGAAGHFLKSHDACLVARGQQGPVRAESVPLHVRKRLVYRPRIRAPDTQGTAATYGDIPAVRAEREVVHRG